MECPHCFVFIHVPQHSAQIFLGPNEILPGWLLNATVCPNCRNPIIELSKSDQIEENFLQSSFLVYPRFPTRTRVDDAVPAPLRDDYAEASDVLSISPKASAALSRRILQAILKEQGYKSSNLSKQISDVLSETDASKALPNYIRDVIDAIRNFGNFAAHPITDETSLQIIDVIPMKLSGVSK